MSEVKEPSGVSIGGESLRASPKVLTAGDRKLLKVELRPGDTTYVSWKKLMRDASKVNGSSASVPDPPPDANPNLESRIAPVSLMLHEMVHGYIRVSICVRVSFAAIGLSVVLFLGPVSYC